MANLNLDPDETRLLVTGFLVAHRMFRGGSIPTYYTLKKFVLAIEVSKNKDALENLLTKLNQLAKDGLNEPTNMPSL